jgi:hypothetical protein
MLYHPQVANVPCEDCQKWVYDKNWRRAQRGGQDVPRPPGTPTPCQSCPKKSPEHAKTLILTRRNSATLRRFYEQQATCGACLTEEEKGDAWLIYLFGLIGKELRQFERQEQLEVVAKLCGAAKGA